jgi:hypothetical protein
MTDKAAMISYTWLTKQQLAATNGRQSSNDQLQMPDKAGISRYTWLKKQKLSGNMAEKAAMIS